MYTTSRSRKKSSLIKFSQTCLKKSLLLTFSPRHVAFLFHCEEQTIYITRIKIHRILVPFTRLTQKVYGFFFGFAWSRTKGEKSKRDARLVPLFFLSRSATEIYLSTSRARGMHTRIALSCLFFYLFIIIYSQTFARHSFAESHRTVVLVRSLCDCVIIVTVSVNITVIIVNAII